MKTEVLKTAVYLCSVVGLACVPGNNPIRATAIYPVDNACETQDDLQIGRGRLDASGAGTYIVTIVLESELVEADIVASGGDRLTTPGQNNFVIDERYLTYTARDPAITFEPERIPTFGLIKPGDVLNSTGNIIGPKAAVKLRDNVTDPAADPLTTLLVTVQYRGHLESGQQISTNAIVFPITVFTTNASCAGAMAPTGPCMSGGGQDGAPITCL